MSAFAIIRAEILQLVAAPAPLADDQGNLVVAYALCELECTSAERSDDGQEHEEKWIGREIFPVGSSGTVMVPREFPDVFYKLHALGDTSRDFAELVDRDGERIIPSELTRSQP